MKRCTQEFRSRGANFLLAQVDLVDPTRPPRNMRIVCVDKQLKVRNADTDKTEVKVKLGSGCVRVRLPVCITQSRILLELQRSVETITSSLTTASYLNLVLACFCLKHRFRRIKRFSDSSQRLSHPRRRIPIQLPTTFWPTACGQGTSLF